MILKWSRFCLESVRSSRKGILQIMKRIELFNGVHLSIIPSEKFKTNFMSVNFVVPLERTTAHTTALVPKVLSRGSRKYPDMALISEKLEYLYDSSVYPIYSKRAESVIFGFGADFIKDRYVPDGKGLLEDVADILFDILFDPLTVEGAFRSDYTESEKADLINTINAKINNKASYAKEKCTEIMFKSRPYGLSELGNVSDVKRATPHDVYMRYQEIVRTAPIEIFFSGECDEEALAETVRKYVPHSDLRKTEFPKDGILSGTPEEINEFDEEMPVAQGKLVMGFRIGGINVNSDDAAAFTVFNEIFGGSPQSKLFMNVREAMSLCYYCRSIPDMYISAMFVTSGIESCNKQKAYDAILLQLESVKNGEFTDEDLADAKRSIRNAYKELDDSAFAICRWYLSRIIAGNDYTPYDIIEAIEKVSAEDVVNAAQKVALDTVYFINGTAKAEEDE